MALRFHLPSFIQNVFRVQKGLGFIHPGELPAASEFKKEPFRSSPVGFSGSGHFRPKSLNPEILTGVI